MKFELLYIFNRHAMLTKYSMQNYLGHMVKLPLMSQIKMMRSQFVFAMAVLKD